MKKIELERIEKILIVALGGIGNTILFTPALRALRESLPKSKITLLTGEFGIEGILENEKLIDEVVMLDRLNKFSLATLSPFISKMRKKKFDLCIVSGSTNAFRGSLLSWLMGIPNRVGEDIKGKGWWYTVKVPYQENTHETDSAYNLMKAIGVSLPLSNPELRITSAEKDEISQFLLKNGYEKDVPLVGIHAGSGAKQLFKRWPKERFAQLADRLIKEYKVRIVLTGGNLEVGLNGEIFRMMESFPINAAGILSLRQTAALIEKCQLFISNDSGVAHIAAAVKTPLIVLFGKTNIERIAPRGENVNIIQKGDDAEMENDPMDRITVDDVIDVVKGILNKEDDG